MKSSGRPAAPGHAPGALRGARSGSAASIEDFLAAPAGRYVRGDRWLFFSWGADGPYGTILAGRPEARDLAELCRCYPHGEGREIDRPAASLFDASQLDGFDREAFETMAGYFTSYADVHVRLVTRVAIVHGGGLAGATVAGFARTVGLRAPVELFSQRAEAVAWLGAEPALAEEIARLSAILTAEDPLISRLRAALAGDQRDASVKKSARALGVSERSLQRALQKAGTTFQAALARARVDAARRMLAETETKLAAIAFAVGCGSPQRFSELFRKETGLSPSEYRRRAGLTRTPRAGE